MPAPIETGGIDLLSGGEAPIDVQDLAGHEVGGRRCEKQRRPDDVLGIRDTAKWNALVQVIAKLGIVHDVADHFSINKCGRYAVHRDAITRKLNRVLLDYERHTTFGAAVSRVAAILQTELSPYRQQMYLLAACP